MKPLFTLFILAPLVFIAGAVKARKPVVPASVESPGDLDATFSGFGVNGFVHLGDLAVFDVARQPNGSVLVAGANEDNYALRRYMPNGSLDSGFGNGGTLDTGIPFLVCAANVTVDSSARILLAAGSSFAGGDGMFVARYNSVGGADSSFGNNGIASVDFGESDCAEDVALQADGKIMLAGYARINGHMDFAVARLLENGQLDSGFSSDGKASVDFFSGGTGDDFGAAMVIQPDGKIVVGGRADQGGVAGDVFGLARFTASGALDASFDGDGRVETDLGPGGVNDLAFDSVSSTLVAVGSAMQGGTRLAVARYNLGGAAIDTQLHSLGGDLVLGMSAVVGVDRRVSISGVWNQFQSMFRLEPGFDLDLGLNGVGMTTVTQYEATALIPYTNLAVQPDGNYLFAARTDRRAGLVKRFDQGSFPDMTGAAVWGHLGGGDDVVRDLAVQPDGSVIAAGEAAALPGDLDAAVVRYTANGNPDTSFGEHGVAHFGLAQDEHGRALALQPDGKIVVAGFVEASDDHMAVWRFNPDGSMDGTFKGLGVTIIDFDLGDDAAQAVAVLPGGKILIGGQAANGSSPGNNDFALVRLEADGDLDSTFGTGGLVRTTIGSGNVQARDMVVLDDGRIVLGGVHDSGGEQRGEFALAGYLPDGSLDPDFGDQGTGIVELGFFEPVVDGVNFFYDIIQAMTVLPNGDILATGYSGGDWATVIFNDDGSLANYNVIWPARIDWGIEANPNGIALQEDGKVVIAGGGVNSGEANSQFFLARYEFSPFGFRLDAEFGEGGKVMKNFQQRSHAFGVAIDGEDIYAGGYGDNGHDRDFVVANFLAGEIVVAPAGTPRLYLPAVFR